MSEQTRCQRTGKICRKEIHQLSTLATGCIWMNIDMLTTQHYCTLLSLLPSCRAIDSTVSRDGSCNRKVLTATRFILLPIYEYECTVCTLLNMMSYHSHGQLIVGKTF